MNPESYSHSYRLPDIPSSSNFLGHDAHATIQATAHSAESSLSTNAVPDGSFDPHQPGYVIHPHGHLPHQFSQLSLSGGYPSAGPFQSVNYPPYPPPQEYYPPPVAFTPHSAAPYYQPHLPSFDREGSWYSPYQEARQSNVTAGYHNNYHVPYLTYSQRDPLSASAPSPPTNPLNAQISPCPPSHEQRLAVHFGQGGKEAKVRRPYHPNPPAYNLQWVMWVGNVVADATHDELWRFFTAYPEGTTDGSAQSGVVSIFLISRTSCAFVNYDAEDQLNAAIKHFNGHPLRPGDPRCPKLVCRIRRTEDDLKAGVGWQRGMGMHVRWIKEQGAKDAAFLDVLPKISISRSDDIASTVSTPSTNSSLLARFFPQRYFILKSLSQVISNFYRLPQKFI
ncbi:hypothetical protein C0993_002195 [Termitomyces sp. T159_Od127]|nr:hypothetical protein C0993_002195 [Termitomyces sp. T159_Od127]